LATEKLFSKKLVAVSMKYPITLIEIQKDLSLYVPDPACVKSTYERLVLKDPKTPFPFWAKIWASSKALTQYLNANPNLIKGNCVVEMGAGIGIPSLSIAKLAKELMISDHDSDAVALLEKNIELLGLKNASAKCIDWNDMQEDIVADVILLSDINYAPDQFDSLIHLIENQILKGTLIIIATPQRIMGTSFINAIEPYIKESNVITINEEGTQTDIKLIVLSKKV
jgi:predicted nicotinamide N-methyase